MCVCVWCGFRYGCGVAPRRVQIRLLARESACPVSCLLGPGAVLLVEHVQIAPEDAFLVFSAHRLGSCVLLAWLFSCCCLHASVQQMAEYVSYGDTHTVLRQKRTKVWTSRGSQCARLWHGYGSWACAGQRSYGRAPHPREARDGLHVSLAARLPSVSPCALRQWPCSAWPAP